MKNIKQMNIIELFAALDNTNKQLETIKNDPAYIDAKVKEIWPDKPALTNDQQKELQAIIDLL